MHTSSLCRVLSLVLSLFLLISHCYSPLFSHILPYSLPNYAHILPYSCTFWHILAHSCTFWHIRHIQRGAHAAHIAGSPCGTYGSVHRVAYTAVYTGWHRRVCTPGGIGGYVHRVVYGGYTPLLVYSPTTPWVYPTILPVQLRLGVTVTAEMGCVRDGVLGSTLRLIRKEGALGRLWSSRV